MVGLFNFGHYVDDLYHQIRLTYINLHFIELCNLLTNSCKVSIHYIILFIVVNFLFLVLFGWEYKNRK